MNDVTQIHGPSDLPDISMLAEEVGAGAQAGGLTIGVAESLTGGLVSSHLAAVHDASSWFRGGVVAYSLEAKHRLLDYGGRDPVSLDCARTMARSVRDRLGADVAVAVTGVGGPGPEDGVAAGTVWSAVRAEDVDLSYLLQLPGESVEAVTFEAVYLSISMLATALAVLKVPAS